jgi:metal-responsive CopG/Arc/MetJ family transcriptional regulator
MTRIEVDLPHEQLQALAKLSEGRSVSRTALIREAVAEYLEKHQRGALDEAFALWRDRQENGLRYQERLRAEWE